MTAPPLDPPGAPPAGVLPDAALPDAALPAGVLPDAALPAGAAVPGGAGESTGFTVRLDNFTGPFDLLLQLIGKHKLDVTEVALHRVTDEFIAYIRAMGDQWDLDEASEFLLIAATLLDLKAARLLPSAEVENEEDLALLEARDLLFARLLQYKAYKEAAAHIAELEAVGGRRYPRAVTLEPRYAEALPDLVLGIGPERLLRLAVKAMTPKLMPEVSIAHVHMVRVSVREHAAILAERLRRAGTATFSLLCVDCTATLEVVARFLALLELYREGLVSFVQEQALAELTVRWTGPEDASAADLHVDEYAGEPAEAATAGASPPAGLPPDASSDLVSANRASTDVAFTDVAFTDAAFTDLASADLVSAEPASVEPVAVDVASAGSALADPGGPDRSAAGSGVEDGRGPDWPGAGDAATGDGGAEGVGGADGDGAGGAEGVGVDGDGEEQRT